MPTLFGAKSNQAGDADLSLPLHPATKNLVGTTILQQQNRAEKINY